MTEWDYVLETRASKIDTLKTLIPGYDYSSEEHAHRTDDNFCRLLVENLRESKSVMFNVLQTAFELHRDVLLKDFQQLKDELDALSDEIKARVFKWDTTSQK